MEKLTNSLRKNIDHIKNLINNDPDIKEKRIHLKNVKNEICILYSDSLCDGRKINEIVLDPIINIFKDHFILRASKIADMIADLVLVQNQKVDKFEDVLYNLFSGNTIILINNVDFALTVDTKLDLSRAISEPTTEVTTKGPKEAFVEDFNKNLGLIRKRIKDKKMKNENFNIGRRTKTKVGLIYIEDITEIKLVEKIKEKLQQIDIDGIFDSAYILELINKEATTLFPTTIRTERPDVAAMTLLDGKIIILVDNSPFVLILPAFFIDFIHAAEDNFDKPINASWIRIIRLISFFIVVFLPAYYISVLTHDQEAIPPDLLISFKTQREGVPFPIIIEVLIMSLAFDILSEADIRLPNAMGSAISIVGALILGEAAIQAGIASPITVIIVATTSVSALCLPSKEFTNAVKLWRLLFMFIAISFGNMGLIIGSLSLIFHMANIKSFGFPYLRGLAPFSASDQKNFIARFSRKKLFKRPSLISDPNPIRLKEVNKK